MTYLNIVFILKFLRLIIYSIFAYISHPQKHNLTFLLFAFNPLNFPCSFYFSKAGNFYVGLPLQLTNYFFFIPFCYFFIIFIKGTFCTAKQLWLFVVELMTFHLHKEQQTLDIFRLLHYHDFLPTIDFALIENLSAEFFLIFFFYEGKVKNCVQL